MKTNGANLTIVVLAAAALAAGCAPATAPSQPSWDEDVYPIIRGSCSHCHGETVGQREQPISRYDICDSRPFEAAQVTTGILKLGTGASRGSSLLAFPVYLNPSGVSGRPQMPPPPASPLSSYEKDVLLNWLTNVSEQNKCIKKGVNREPAVRMVVDPQDSANGLQLVLDVTDPDGDTVLGQVTAGMNPVSVAPIPASGRRWITVPFARRGDPITVRVHDGFIPAAKEFNF
jgi:hypothetical protein